MPALRVRLIGVPVEVRASFLLFVTLIGLPMHPSVGPLLAWVAIASVAVLAHEFGHAAAFRALGDRPQITLHGAGGETRGMHQGVTQMILVSAAGPATGLALGLAIALIARAVEVDAGYRFLVDDALFLTIGLSLVNLVPLAGLDGNSILNGLVTSALGRPAGAAGWMVGALTVFGIVGGALVIGRWDVALFVTVVIVVSVFQAGSLVDVFGAAADRRSAPALLSLGRAEEALGQADSALRRDPDSLEALGARAAALGSLTRYAEAEAAYTRMLELRPDSQPALAGRFAARQGQGDAAGAADDMARLLALEPADIESMTARFFALYRANRFGDALALLGAWLEQPELSRPEVQHLRGLQAVLQVATGQPAAALRQADALIETRPDNAALHELRALALIQLGRLDDAVVASRRALTGAARNPELLETAGIAARLSGQPEVAIELLMDAAVARPELPRARAELSACFSQLGRHPEAAAALDNLPAWTANDPSVRYARGCIAAAAGDLGAAAEHVAAAAAIRPGLALVARVDPLLRPALEGVPAQAGQTLEAPAAGLGAV